MYAFPKAQCHLLSEEQACRFQDFAKESKSLIKFPLQARKVSIGKVLGMYHQ